MAKFKVYGFTKVYVDVEVEVDEEELEGLDEDELEELLFEKAWNENNGLTDYVGNGGYDQLVGVNNSNVSLNPSEETEYNDFEKLED